MNVSLKDPEYQRKKKIELYPTNYRQSLKLWEWEHLTYVAVCSDLDF